MPRRTETEYVIFTIFLIGVIVAIYYLISVLTSEVDPAVILEKTILIGVMMAILIILAIVLLKQTELRNHVEMLKEAGVPKPVRKRTAKDVKKDMMRIYRDMGALKIILQDNIIDQETYDREKRELDERIKVLKKEEEKLTK